MWENYNGPIRFSTLTKLHIMYSQICILNLLGPNSNKIQNTFPTAVLLFSR